jgi:nucleotide-binding universal stress UspA family protein
MGVSKKQLTYQKILIPITGTAADDETIQLACRIAKRDKSKLLAMYVITVERSLPVEAEIDSEIKRGEELLEHAERIAGAEESELETSLLQAREVGPAIIDEAMDKKVDLILMGVKYKRRFGQFNLSAILLHVLRNAPCNVILYYQYGGSQTAII